MSVFLLIRHGANDLVGHTIAGWMPGVHLNSEGRAQAERIAEHLSPVGICRIVSSPLERAIETAEPLARLLGLQVETCDALGEFRGGEWTGKTFHDLETDPRWRLFNSYRSGTRVPGGEAMAEVQVRVVTAMQDFHEQSPDGTLALFSHGDVIRAAVMYYAGIAIDLFQRIEISPASISTIELQPWGPRILNLNQTL